jgi:hypothetical protein
MINADNVQTHLAHERKIDIDLLGPSEIISFRVRLEWTVGNPFNKKLSVIFEEEFRDWANSRVRCHLSGVSRCYGINDFGPKSKRFLDFARNDKEEMSPPANKKGSELSLHATVPPARHAVLCLFARFLPGNVPWK